MICRPPPSPLKNSHFHFCVQIVTQCSKTNEKSIFRFLVLRYDRSNFFEKCEFFFHLHNFFHRNVLKRILKVLRFLAFKIWLILYSTFESELATLTNSIMLGGLRPTKPLGSWGAWRLTPLTGGTTPRPRMLLDWIPSSQLVIGYHWLAFLNQVRKNHFLRNKSRIYYECWVQNLPYLKH